MTRWTRSPNDGLHLTYLHSFGGLAIDDAAAWTNTYYRANGALPTAPQRILRTRKLTPSLRFQISRSATKHQINRRATSPKQARRALLARLSISDAWRETGWPTNSMTTAGLTYEGATAGVPQLQTFLDTFVCAANTNGTEYFFFSPWDEPWCTSFY